MEKAKRRAVAQKVGRQGELIFAAWATEGNFSASKLEDDFGVDFVCQHMLPTVKGSQEVTGLTVLVQVRATSTDKKPRIGFSREDVATAMCQDGLFCVAGVHMPTKEVYFRWLDIPLLEEWAGFLRSSRGTVTMRLDKMSKGVDRFSREITKMSRLPQRAMFQKARIRLRLQDVIPGAQLKTNTGAMGDWAAVLVPNLLAVVNAGVDAHETLAQAMFRPVPFAQGFRDVLAHHKPYPALTAVQDLVDGPLLVVGYSESKVTLQIEHEGKQMLSPFVLRRVQDERAYIGASGLVLRITDARETGGRHLHHLSWSIEPEGAVDLQTSNQLDFLRMLRPGAQLNEAGRPLIAIENFGVQGIGRSIRAIEQVCALLNMSLTNVGLADLLDEAFAHNLGIIEALSVATERFKLPAFIVDLPEGQETSDEAWEACRYRIPITMRIKDYGLLCWVEGEADAYIQEGSMRGFRFRTTDDAEISVTDLPPEVDSRATVYFDPDWSTLIIGCEKPTFGAPFKSLPFRGQFAFKSKDEDRAKDHFVPQ